MSVEYVRVCSQILHEFFGFATQKVGDFLLREGPQSFRSIVLKTGLSRPRVKEILKLLIQHNLVSFSSKSACSNPVYAAESHNIYFLLRLQRAFAHIQQQLGLEARGIVEEIVCRGHLPLSTLLFICGRKYFDEHLEKILSEKEVLAIVENHLETFQALAVNHYVCRAPDVIPDQEALVPHFTVNEHLKYSVPPIRKDIIAERIIAGNSNLQDLEDALICWRIDVDNFYREWRDEIVISALKKRYKNFVDDKIIRILAGNTFSCSLSDGLPLESPWLSYNELEARLSRYAGEDIPAGRIDEHLEIMLTDPKCVLLVENPNVGPYCLNYAAAMSNIMCELVEHIILERHGFFAARIFRLIKDKKYVEQDRIGEVGMIPSHEAKTLSFLLLRDNFIKMREIRKTYNATAATNKIAFFYYVDINEVAAGLLETSFKSITNSQIRRGFEKYNYRTILAKQERVTRILNTVRARGATVEQLQDIEDLVTPPEREMLRKASSCNDKLVSAVFHIDDTVFMLQQYFNCLKKKTLVDKTK